MNHRHALVGLLFVIAVALCSVAIAEVPPRPGLHEEPIPLVMGSRITLRSEVLGEDRELLIYVPKELDTIRQPLPVIVLLDGRAHFPLTIATVDLLVRNARMPRSMVVGIANTDRGRDFTAIKTDERSSGGADRFLEFLASELFPYLDANFPTSSHRTLIGHSLGGLFVMHALIEAPELFRAAIAISPAVSADERVGDGARPVSARLRSVLADRGSLPFSLFITMSEREDPRWIGDLDAILDVLRNEAPRDFRWQMRQMEGEDHGTTVLGSTDRGLRFINADWDTSKLVREGTKPEVVEHFEALSHRLGFQLLPPEGIVNLIGYRLLGEKRLREAVEVFEYNVSLYPDSANVHDSLGEALEQGGKLPGALRSYRRAVSRGEATADRNLPVYRAHLVRVERLLSGEGVDRRSVFEETERGQPDGG